MNERSDIGVLSWSLSCSCALAVPRSTAVYASNSSANSAYECAAAADSLLLIASASEPLVCYKYDKDGIVNRKKHEL